MYSIKVYLRRYSHLKGTHLNFPSLAAAGCRWLAVPIPIPAQRLRLHQDLDCTLMHDTGAVRQPVSNRKAEWGSALSGGA